jgi:acyl-CoA carboxylase subunit beta
MGTLDTAVDPRTQSYLDNRSAMLAALATLECAFDAAREGGGERAITRHHARGKLLARERIELLVDRDSPLLELSTVAGWGANAPVGAGVVTAIGVVADRPCVIIANDPTVRGGAVSGWGLKKILRAQQIAHHNRLPLVCLLEPGGVEPGDQSEIFLRGGQFLAGLARLGASRIPSVGVFFGPRPAGVEVAAPGDWFDYLIMLRGHATTSAPVDHLAEDDRDALRLTRRCARGFRQPPPVTGSSEVIPPRHDPEDLLAVPPADAHEIVSRILDGSEFEQAGPAYASAVCTGWGKVHGHPVAVLADAHGPVTDDDTRRVARFIRRAETAGVPLLFLRHGGPATPAAEATTVAAVAAAVVPVVTLRVGDWGGLPAVGAEARFRFAWPNTRGGLDLTGGDPNTPGSSALYLSGRLDDDGLIDPRDTRTVLGFCLWIIAGARS